MDSGNDKDTAAVVTPKLPIGTYIMAAISGLFVTVGLMLAVAFSHLFFGDWVNSAPKIVLGTIPIAAILLGIQSARQTLRQARKKAI